MKAVLRQVVRKERDEDMRIGTDRIVTGKRQKVKGLEMCCLGFWLCEEKQREMR